MIHPHREAISVVPDPDEAAAALGELENLLWRERGILERLLYRLASQASLVERGDWRWLPISDLEVRDSIAPLQTCELARAAVTDELAARYGLAGDVSLLALVAVVPEPWPGILTDHRNAFRQLEKEIRDYAAQTAQQVRAEFGLDDEAFGLDAAGRTGQDEPA